MSALQSPIPGVPLFRGGGIARFLAVSALYRMGFHRKNADAPTAVGIGDSITIGHSLPALRFAASDSYFDRLSISGDVNWLGNAGIRSQTSAQILPRLQREVIDRRPQVAFVLLGTNDVVTLEDIPRASTMANIEEIRRRLVDAGIVPIFGTIPPDRREPETVSEFNTQLAEWAEGAGVVLADYWSALAGEDGTFAAGTTRDGTHPTPEGASRMAVVAREALALALRQDA